MKRMAWIAIALTLGAQVGAQERQPTGAEVIKRALDLFRNVNDYTATMTLEVSGPKLRVPKRTFKLYYKKPDKLKVVSEDLVVLPKDSVLFLNRLGDEVAQHATITVESKYDRDGVTFYRLRVRPKDSAENEAASLVVIVNGSNWTVGQLYFFEGDTRVASVIAEYAHVEGKYWLPVKVSFRAEEQHGAELDGPVTATLTWTDYRVNTGLKDDLFKEQAE